MDIRALRILSSIPTNTIDTTSNKLIGMGSGCFVKYDKFTLFLTVYHTIDKDNNHLTTGIVSDFNADKGVKLLPLTLIPPIITGNIKSSEMEIVDFAYQKMLQMPKCYYFDVDGMGNLKNKIERIKLITNFTDVPSKTEDYGFAGYIYGDITQNPNVGAKFQDILNQELGYYDGLKYEQSVDDYHIFSLPNNDYEKESFMGTSGAPILDSKGKLVALVSRGKLSADGAKWIIKGINLSKYKTILDIECGLI